MRSVSACLPWLRRGAWTLSDQALFSLATVAVNVLLARWLPARAYGAFAFAYSSFLLLGTVHTALLGEPLLVFGAGKYADALPGYVELLLRAHWLLVGACSAVLAAVGAVVWRFGTAVVGEALVGAAAAAPFILLNWLLRRACYVTMRPRWAALAGGLSLAVTVLGLLALRRAGALSVGAAFAVVATGNALASLWLAARVRRAVADPGAARPARAAVLRDHWAYGRWAIGTGALSWAPTDLYVLVLPLWGGLRASAALKALTMLIMPAVQAQNAASYLLTPALVRARGASHFARMLGTVLVCFVAFSSTYWLLLVAARGPLVHGLYGGRYDEIGPLLWFMGALPVAHGVGEAFADALRALQRPDRVFWGAAATMATTVGVGLAAAARWGVAGAAAGQLASVIAAAVVMGVSLLRLRARVRPAVATIGS